jgi:antitoxin component YwqK of YwqJK toxin-antitoxin module
MSYSEVIKLHKLLLTCLVLLLSISAAHAQQSSRIIEERYDSLTTKAIYTMLKDSTGQDIKDGLFVEWYPDGTRKREGAYKQNKLDGRIVEYREDLTKEFEKTYDDGKLVKTVEFGKRGLYPTTVEDSLEGRTRIEEVVLPNGRKVSKEGFDRTKTIFINHGPATVWYYDGGPVMEKGNFKRAKPDGLMVHWDAFGQKEFEGTFDSGNRDGLWIYWDGSGKLIRIDIYRNDSIVDKREF